MKEIKDVLAKFSESGWDLIAIPSRDYLSGKANKSELVSAVRQAEKECGSCGCELDNLYKVFLENVDSL